MESNNTSNNSNVVDQQLPTEQNTRPKSTLNMKFLLIAAIVFILIALSVIFISVKSTTNKIIPANPTETPKPTLQPLPSEGGYVKNQLIVEYKAGMSPHELTDNSKREKLATSLQELGVISQEKLHESTDPKLTNFYVLTFEQGIDLEKVRSKIYALEEIKNVDPNTEYEAFENNK